MRKVLVIALREYQAAVRTRSFLISMIALPLLMGGGVAVQTFLKGGVDRRPKRFAVIDRTPGQQLLPEIERAARERNETPAAPFIIEPVAPSPDDPEAINEQRYRLSERVRKSDLFGFLDIGRDVIAGQPGKAGAEEPDALETAAGLADADVPDRYRVRYQSNSPTYDAFRQWAQRVLTRAVQERRLAAARTGLTQADLQRLLRRVPLTAKGLSKQDATTGTITDAEDESPIISALVPAGLMFLMFMVVMVGATPMMQGVVEEKSLRIAEVLLGSVRPFQLMMGKLLGMVAVSLTLSAVYLAGAYLAVSHFGFTSYLPAGLLAWFLLFQTLAVLMFGSLFVAIGAACTDLRETQAMVWPVVLLVTVPMLVWVEVLREPNSTFATTASFFPFATPMLMMLRLAVPPGVPWWQPPAGVALVLATTLLCVYAAGRIFRVGILVQGKGARLGQVARWVFRG